MSKLLGLIKVTNKFKAYYEKEVILILYNSRSYHPPGEAEGEFKVDHDKPVAGRIVSKKHLGEFLVDCLTQEEHIHKRIGLGTVAPPQQPPQQ